MQNLHMYSTDFRRGHPFYRIIPQTNTHPYSDDDEKKEEEKEEEVDMEEGGVQSRREEEEE